MFYIIQYFSLILPLTINISVHKSIQVSSFYHTWLRIVTTFIVR